ncbi:MAG: hypothetical protein KA004_11590 [Verrucomicrobiales bacterium]|nr:hypothetical protein [Verrucomicrobiales bacterium]
MEKTALTAPVIHAPPQASDSGPAFAPLLAPEEAKDVAAALAIDFSSSTGTQEEWNEAYARLGDYFRAMRIHSRLHRTWLVLEILRRAAKTHAAHPDKSPTFVALHVARRMQRDWMRAIIGDLNISEGRMDVNGRLAFLLCEGPRHWPHYFLSRDALPPGMTKGMRVRIEQSGPDLAVSSMVPRQIDLGLVSEITDDTIDTLGRHPFLRYLLLLALSALVIYGIWTVTH